MIGHNKEANDTNASTDNADSNWQSKSEESPEMSSALHKKRSSPVQEDENSNCSTDSQSDSASLPYQYLIERDIERELENSKNAKISKESAAHVNGAENLCDSSVNDADAGSKSPKDSRKISKQKLRSESRDNDSLPPPDVANLRSSDITDLVMKGLMFTIRQDKDTVTVVEQKTKLELDEVLENSEKVETKEGDPCLLNSSLLRLEKMITRMQEPPASLPEQKRNGSSENALVSFMDLANEINIDSEQRLNEAEIAEKREVDLNASDLETANCWSQFFTDKDITDSTFDNIEKVLGDSSIYINDDNLDVDLELRIDDEEEEDIIPEALRNQEIFKNGLDALTKMPTSLPSFQDLLMDDDDQADINVTDIEGDINITTSTSNGKLNTDVTNTVKNISKLPKVISNQIITNDQIPPALLKALKSKPTVQSSQINEVNKNFKKFNEVPENNNKINMPVKVKIQDSEINNEIGDVAISKKEEGNSNNKQKDFIMYKSNDILDGLKVSCSIEKISDKILLKNMNVKDIDTSNTDSNSTESTRLTRSNSKIFAKSNDTSVSLNVSLTNHENYLDVQMHQTAEIQHLKPERSVETRNQKLSEKSLQSSTKISCSTFNGNSSECENLTETNKTEDKLHVKTDEISEPLESTIKTEYSVETRSKKSGDKQHSKSDGTSSTSNESKVENEHVVETRSRKTGDKSILKLNEVSSSTLNGKNVEHEHLIETRSQKSESKSSLKLDETLPEMHKNKIELDHTIEKRNKKSGDKSCLKSGETSLASNNKNTAKHENAIETRSRKQGDRQSLKPSENTSSSESIVESENSMETRSHRSGVKLYSKSIEMSSGTLDESISRPERSLETKNKKIGDKPQLRSNELSSSIFDGVTTRNQHSTETRSHKSDNHKSHLKSNETSISMFNGKTVRHECSVGTRSQKVEEPSHLKCNGTTSSPSKSVTYERTIETRAQKLVEKNPINEVNKFLLDKTLINRKRRRSAIDQISLKRHKSSNGTDEKEVTVQVWKLLNHLRYGVKVVVERVDVENFSR